MSISDDGDLFLALRLFDGKLLRKIRDGSNYHSPEQGLFHISMDLSPQEVRESQSAISRLLQSADPPRDLLNRLAAAFAPEGDPNAGAMKASVRLRGANVLDLKVHASQIILEIQLNRRAGMSLANAQSSVDEMHGYKGAAKAIWQSAKWRELRKSIIATLAITEKGAP